MTSGLYIAVGIVVALAVGAVFYNKLLAALKWRHRRQWESLGRPSSVTPLMVATDPWFRLHSFIFSSAPRSTGDRELAMTVTVLRMFFLAAIVAVIGGAGLAIWQLLMG